MKTGSSPNRKPGQPNDGTDPLVVFLPDGLLPVETGYRPLLNSLNTKIRPVLKTLEVYRTNRPPCDYGLEMEIQGIYRCLGQSEPFHFVGYSGGASIALAFAIQYPSQVLTMALVEPAWIGNQELTELQIKYWANLEKVWSEPLEQRISLFIRENLRQGVLAPPPLPNPPPHWIANRPEGLTALAHAFKRYDLEIAKLAEFDRPVYLALGSLSHPVEEEKASALSRLFPHIQVEIYEGRHHFDPPHRAEPIRFAAALQRLWTQSNLSPGSQA